MSQSSDSESASAEQVAATTLQLPAFAATDALAWFLRAEIIFRNKKVVQSTKKADLVLAALPEDIFPQISTWLLEKGDSSITYEETKIKLLNLYTPTAEERAERLLILSRLPLANQRPSAAYEEMRALATLPDKRSVDLLRVLWLLRLPDSVREAMIDFMNPDLQQLTSTADARMAATRQSRTVAPATEEPHDDDDDDIAAAAKPLRRYIKQNTSQQHNGLC